MNIQRHVGSSLLSLNFQVLPKDILVHLAAALIFLHLHDVVSQLKWKFDKVKMLIKSSKETTNQSPFRAQKIDMKLSNPCSWNHFQTHIPAARPQHNHSKWRFPFGMFFHFKVLYRRWPFGPGTELLCQVANAGKTFIFYSRRLGYKLVLSTIFCLIQSGQSIRFCHKFYCCIYCDYIVQTIYQSTYAVTIYQRVK